VSAAPSVIASSVPTFGSTLMDESVVDQGDRDSGRFSTFFLGAQATKQSIPRHSRVVRQHHTSDGF
jgi:hypothetical protein